MNTTRKIIREIKRKPLWEQRVILNKLRADPELMKPPEPPKLRAYTVEEFLALDFSQPKRAQR
jgi:hypothetical protein